MIAGIWKPWFLYRPDQLVRRVAGMFEHPRAGYEPIGAAWGMTMLANPTEHLGQCLWTTGVYDLAVSEVLFRLVRKDDVVIDAGANIGYMSLLAAVAAGPGGRVRAFEPNPNLIPILTKNIASARERFAMAPVDVHQTALGARREQATLVLPDPSAANDGLAHVESGTAAAGAHAMPITVESLDDELKDSPVGLLKIDVEGHEFPVLQGASNALRGRRIRHVVFEDHRGPGSEASTFLERAGYTLFSIGWSMTRPLLASSRTGASLATYYEAPSYLATLEPDEAIRACAATGWRSLRRQTRAREHLN
jgi:FkbM family methyltransferase